MRVTSREQSTSQESDSGNDGALTMCLSALQTSSSNHLRCLGPTGHRMGMLLDIAHSSIIFFFFSLQTTRKMDLLSRLGQEKCTRGRSSTQGWMCPTLTNLDWAAKSKIRRRHACGPYITRCMEETHGESVRQRGKGGQSS